MVESLNKLSVSVPVSVGELIDKITILEIKLERISSTEKLANIKNELSQLRSIQQSIPELSSNRALELSEALKAVNAEIWHAENMVRQKVAGIDFDKRISAYVQQTYTNNDRRYSLKQEINLLLNSDIVEEKFHEE